MCVLHVLASTRSSTSSTVRPQRYPTCTDSGWHGVAPCSEYRRLVRRTHVLVVLLAGPTQQQFFFLETIQEETSDDLRSESSRSSHAGWPDSDSEAGSVIHIAATYTGE